MIGFVAVIVSLATTAPPPSIPGYELIQALSDEFNGDQLDSSKWSTSRSILGWQGRAPGLFDSSNVVVKDGSLQLWARAAKRNDSWPAGYDNYTTAAVHSLATVKHGYFEIRWRSGSSGISSSWWFHQNNGTTWTEIDVFETTGVTYNGTTNTNNIDGRGVERDGAANGVGSCVVEPRSGTFWDHTRCSSGNGTNACCATVWSPTSAEECCSGCDGSDFGFECVAWEWWEAGAACYVCSDEVLPYRGLKEGHTTGCLGGACNGSAAAVAAAVGGGVIPQSRSLPLGADQSNLLPSHVHVFKLPNTTTAQLPALCGGCKSHNAKTPPCSKPAYYDLPKGQTFASDFHTASLNWTEIGITVALNGVIVNTITSPCLIEEIGMDFDRETMPGWMALPDPKTLPDQPFQVDYVRSYQRVKHN